MPLNYSANFCIHLATFWRVRATLLKATANFCIHAATLLNHSAIFCLHAAKFWKPAAIFPRLLSKFQRVRVTLLNQSAIFCLQLANFPPLCATRLSRNAIKCCEAVQDLPLGYLCDLKRLPQR